MQGRGVDAVLITDFEQKRDSALRYLTGLPTDAELILYSDQTITLIPWDLELAGNMAQVDEMLDVQDFERSFRMARTHAMRSRLGQKFTLEILPNESYHKVVKIQEEFEAVKIVCDPKGVGHAISKARRVKEAHEIEVLRAGCRQTTRLVDMIQPFIEENPDCREVDLALFLENEMRKLGAEKPAFETLVANATRSAQIHNYPPASTEPLVQQGLALIDFGMLWEGYVTDVTVPMLFGELNPIQQKMIDTTKRIHDQAISRIKPGAFAHEICEEALDSMKAEGLNMPYSLGHGIGLDVHEGPGIAKKPTDPSMLEDWVETPLEAGMVFTIEPGCVDFDHGGTRLENDVLVTATGAELLTNSRILHLNI